MAVMQRYEWCCARCLARFTDAEIAERRYQLHHVARFSTYRRTHSRLLVPLHIACHLAEHSKL